MALGHGVYVYLLGNSIHIGILVLLSFNVFIVLYRSQCIQHTWFVVLFLNRLTKRLDFSGIVPKTKYNI